MNDSTLSDLSSSPPPSQTLGRELDLIEEFLAFTEGLPTPRIFRLWGAISMISSALERRVFVETAAGRAYPNLFILLVGHPTSGKGQTIDRVIDILRGTKGGVKVAPNNVSKAKLVDILEASARKIPIDGGQRILEYSSLAVCAEELSVFLPAHDIEFLGVLTYLFNNPANFDDEKRHVKDTHIVNPQINLLFGAQPDYLAHLLPEAAWGQGFMARFIMVHSSERVDWDVFAVRRKDDLAREKLIHGIGLLTKKISEFEFSPSFRSAYNEWKDNSFRPIPTHSKLRHYIGRRAFFSIKLSMVSAAARGEFKMLEDYDLMRARDWLIEAETTMPDVFREMSSKSDTELLSELSRWAWTIWGTHKKALHKTIIWEWLGFRASSERVPRIFDLAVNSGIIERIAGTETFFPKPRSGGIKE